ncbi:hypothetical protein, partial [Acinetobacter baumannii]
MHEMKQYLTSRDDVHSVIGGIESGLKEQVVSGLSGASRSIFTTIVQESTKKKTLVVTHQLTQAQQLYEDMTEFMDEEHVYLYPVNEL